MYVYIYIYTHRDQDILASKTKRRVSQSGHDSGNLRESDIVWLKNSKAYTSNIHKHTQIRSDPQTWG